MMPFEERRSRFYYITGTDGVGKSTQARLLGEYFQNSEVKYRLLWIRFPFFFSVPLLIYSRWRGYTWHEVIGEVDHGYWDFTRSWIMRHVFPWALFVDAFFAALLKVYLPLRRGELIICERFVLDMLVDLAIALQDPTLISRLPGKLFLVLIPNNAKIVILDLDKNTICSRRPELTHDHALSARMDAFRRLASQLKLPIIDSHQSIPNVLHEVMTLMDIK